MISWGALKRGDLPSLLWPGEVIPEVLCAVPCSSDHERQGTSRKSPMDSSKGNNDLEPFKERLGQLSLLSLEKGRLREDLINICNYLKCRSQVGRSKFFSVVDNNRTRDKLEGTTGTLEFPWKDDDKLLIKNTNFLLIMNDTYTYKCYSIILVKCKMECFY